MEPLTVRNEVSSAVSALRLTLDAERRLKVCIGLYWVDPFAMDQFPQTGSIYIWRLNTDLSALCTVISIAGSAVPARISLESRAKLTLQRPHCSGLILECARISLQAKEEVRPHPVLPSTTLLVPQVIVAGIRLRVRCNRHAVRCRLHRY